MSYQIVVSIALFFMFPTLTDTAMAVFACVQLGQVGRSISGGSSTSNRNHFIISSRSVVGLVAVVLLAVVLVSVVLLGSSSRCSHMVVIAFLLQH